MSARTSRRLVHALNGGTLGTLLASCVAFVGALRFEEPLFSAFCLGASATCLAGGVLLLSYAIYVRSTLATLGADIDHAGPGLLETIRSPGARLFHRISVELTVMRESGRRLRGSLRLRNNTALALRVERVEAQRPAGARVAVAADLQPQGATPVTVEFSAEANRCALPLGPGEALTVEVLVLLPDGAFGGRRLELAIEFASPTGPDERRVLRQRIPG